MSYRAAGGYHGGVRIPGVDEAVQSGKRVTGLTHILYRYPARFAPEFARAAIDEYTDPNDWVLDPFVGGGTSVVEALAAGRRAAAIDLNALAILITRAKTTPLYATDERALRRWLETDATTAVVADPRLNNAPADYVAALAPLVLEAGRLTTPRQREAARALLVHVGQWGLDGREVPVPSNLLRDELGRALNELLAGLDVLATQARRHKLRPSELLRRRILRHGDASQVAAARPWNRLTRRFRLVLTSPPYPSVHVLYHRWQVGGRSETALPYWLSDLRDGVGEAYYTMGGRSSKGESVYFETIVRTFSGLRRLLVPDARIVQLVSFRAPDRQLSMYLEAMKTAGYEAVESHTTQREVPNRRWYYRVSPEREPAHEYLLVHRLRP